VFHLQELIKCLYLLKGQNRWGWASNLRMKQ